MLEQKILDFEPNVILGWELWGSWNGRNVNKIHARGKTVVECKKWPQFLPFLYTHPVVMWISCFFHQEVESISSPLESEYVLWLAFINRMQKKWFLLSSELRPKLWAPTPVHLEHWPMTASIQKPELASLKINDHVERETQPQAGSTHQTCKGENFRLSSLAEQRDDCHHVLTPTETSGRTDQLIPAQTAQTKESWANKTCAVLSQ